MKIAISNIQTWWEERPAPQHLLILLLVLIVALYIWSILLLKPVSNKIAGYAQQSESTQAVVTTLKQQESTLLEMVKNPVTPKLLQEKNRLIQQIAALDKQMEAFSGGSGASAQLISFLKVLLNSYKDLTLVSLQHAPTTSSIAPEIAGLYRQDIIIEFTGGYFPALHYLEGIEKSPWRFINDEMDYQVINYPQAKITLKLHTLTI